ncbi:MAG: M14 family zinc carboxypeptidase [Candidatus Eiseniibacteriota bacterium]|jgi:hypothetical protein
MNPRRPSTDAARSLSGFESPGAVALLVVLLVGLVVTAGGAATTPGVPGAGQAGERYALVQIAAADLDAVTALGIATDHGVRPGEGIERVEIVMSERERQALRRRGIASRVVIDDLTRFYAERAAAEGALWQQRDRLDPGFGMGSMGGYYTNDEVIAKLDEMRADYPDLVSARQQLSITLEGRDLWYVRISDNPDVEEGEPAVLFTGLTHAREPQGMACVLYYMFHLLENYATDPEVRYLVDNREIYCVPVINPDGYVYNESIAPGGGGLWRKNRRPNGGGEYGVDLNRNYGYMWGYDNSGSSPDPGSSTYRGPAAFSELETSGVRFFHQPRTIACSMHYHGYGNYELHPFGYEANALPPGIDYEWYLLYGMDMAAMNGYLVGNPWQTVHYVTNGDAVDWSYGEQVEKNKVFAFIPEVGSSSDGFWPQPSRIVPLAEENLGPNLYWTWVAGGRVLLGGVTAGPEVPRGAESEVVVSVTNTGLGEATDVAVAVTSSDPYVEAILPGTFPVVPPQSPGDDGDDPTRIRVAADAPLGHVIELDVAVLQGEVVRGVMNVSVTVIEGSTAVDAGAPPVTDGATLAARPNPFNPHTDLWMDLGRAGHVTLDLYDVSGHRVRRLVDGERVAGRHRVPFDGRDAGGARLASGVYVARLESAAGAARARIVLLR